MDDARRQRFLDYFAAKLKTREAMMKKTGLSKGRVSQLFDPDEPFGERAARSVAERLGLPVNFFLGDLAAVEHPQKSAPADAPSIDGEKFLPLSQTLTSPPMGWEQLELQMQTRSGERQSPMTAVAPDDGLAGLVDKGDTVVLDFDGVPIEGSVVLVKTLDRRLHLGQYGLRADGSFDVRRLSPSHSWNSLVNGIEVVAVVSRVFRERLLPMGPPQAHAELASPRFGARRSHEALITSGPGSSRRRDAPPSLKTKEK